MSAKTPGYHWYFPTVIALVFGVGLLATTYTYLTVSANVQHSLLERTSALASALEPRDLLSLTGSDQDLANAQYQSLKLRLIKIRQSSPDIRFVYLTGYRAGNPFFLVDSESVESPDYSPPGQVYSEASSAFRGVFVSRMPVIEGIASDRWGTWLTALAPVIDPNTGALLAVMGMDLNARSYYQTVFVYSALPAVAAGFIILLVVIGFVIRRREESFLRFKTELVAIASHEIRTPLTGISWLSESLLAEGKTLSPAERQRLRAIDERSRSLLVTVNDLLDLSAAEKRRQPVTPHEVLVRPMFEKIFSGVSLALEEKQLETQFDRSVTTTAALCGEADRLQMVFSNLVANAVKYSRPRGTITIGYQIDRGSTIVWVKDQGIGVPLADQSKIFEGGYRAENAKQTAEAGTGLGLRYVKETVESFGGRVWCESEEGKGSTFFVQLPGCVTPR